MILGWFMIVPKPHQNASHFPSHPSILHQDPLPSLCLVLTETLLLLHLCFQTFPWWRLEGLPPAGHFETTSATSYIHLQCTMMTMQNMGLSIFMGYPKRMVYNQWENPIFQWMMTGGTPMTKRKPPVVSLVSLESNIELSASLRSLSRRSEICLWRDTCE